MSYGIIFQEYSLSGSKKKTSRFVQLRMAWVILTMFVTMAFVGNLKTSLVKKNFEKRTMTRNEMIDKDMIIHTSTTSLDWYRTPQAQLDPLNIRYLCQAKKKKSIYVTG